VDRPDRPPSLPLEAEPTSDEALFDRVRAGELAPFELLMRRHNQRLFRVARSIVRSDDEAEDVMQEAYVRAYEHRGQFEGRARFATWLTKIAVYEAQARVRRGARVGSLEGDVDETRLEAKGEDGRDPGAQVAGRELGALLEAAVDELPEGMRTTFVLRQVEGLSTAETAECLGLSQEAVKVRLHRARAALRRSLERRLGDAKKEVYPFHLSRCDRVVARALERIRAATPPTA
jgi:RNA polymerase sigma-70 factor (ECF subfamily)